MANHKRKIIWLLVALILTSCKDISLDYNKCIIWKPAEAEVSYDQRYCCRQYAKTKRQYIDCMSFNEHGAKIPDINEDDLEFMETLPEE